MVYLNVDHGPKLGCQEFDDCGEKQQLTSSKDVRSVFDFDLRPLPAEIYGVNSFRESSKFGTSITCSTGKSLGIENMVLGFAQS